MKITDEVLVLQPKVGYLCGVCHKYYGFAKGYVVPLKYLAHVHDLPSNHLCEDCFLELPAVQLQLAMNRFKQRVISRGVA